MQEELVKCMSKLPSYLERGEYQPDKALNFGVLDWCRLEKWQSNQKQKTCELSAMERSSAASDLENNGVSRRPTLQHHLLSSPASFQAKRGPSNGGEATRKAESRSSSPSKFLANRMNSSAIMQMKAKVKNRVDEFVQKRSKLYGGESTPATSDDEIQMRIRAFQAQKLSSFSETSKSVLQPVAARMVPTNARNPQVEDSSKGSKLATEKRSTSPFRRIGIGMSKISKPFTSKESMPAQQPADASDCSSCDKQNGTSRARSSPLRRLIDPLLKSKEPTKHPHRHSHKHSPRSDTISSCGSSESGIANDKRSKSSSSQALLRVAMKNGQPLFTLAVDNEPNILAATMKRLTSSRKLDYEFLYTFFSIQEIKNKNGRWMNQGDKNKSHDYVPNVVAQLKVSGMRDSSENGSSSLEFILSDVKLRKSDAQEVDFQPNNELAAVVLDVQNPNQSLVNAILPSGIHSLPSNGGPSSLIHRWRTGGSCDCGGWDIGCKLRILNNQRHLPVTSISSPSVSPANKFELFQEGGDEEGAMLRLSTFKDGIYSVEFDSMFTVMQAFTVCIAVIEGRKLCEDPL